MIPPPIISAVPAYTSGVISVSVSGLDPVRVFYTIEPLQDGEVNWLEATDIKNGQVTISGLSDYTWYNLIAVYSTSLAVDSLPSNLARVRPVPYKPYYSVDIMRYDQKDYVLGRGTVFRMRLEAKIPRNMPAEIFLYKRETFSGENLETRDVFMAVCKPGDLTRYPAVNPGTGSPLFRLNYVDMAERSMDLVSDIYEGIHEDVQQLTTALDEIREFSIAEEA